jgi:hypothetical protein
MNDTRDQQAAHSPPRLPSGVRHETHKGGNAVSSATPKAARPNCAMRANKEGGSAWDAESSVSDIPTR